jgi:hypothetical protein
VPRPTLVPTIPKTGRETSQDTAALLDRLQEQDPRVGSDAATVETSHQLSAGKALACELAEITLIEPLLSILAVGGQVRASTVERTVRCLFLVKYPD